MPTASPPPLPEKALWPAAVRAAGIRRPQCAPRAAVTADWSCWPRRSSRPREASADGGGSASVMSTAAPLDGGWRFPGPHTEREPAVFLAGSLASWCAGGAGTLEPPNPAPRAARRAP